MSHGRTTLLLMLLCVSARLLVAQVSHPTEFDLDDLRRSVAQASDLRADVEQAAALDTAALHRLFAIASDGSAGDPVYPALLFSMLMLWGDSAFAARVRVEADPMRRVLMMLLDRGAGGSYAAALPLTWSLASHDPAMTPARQQPGATRAAQVPYEADRVYTLSEVDRQPGIEPGSCRQQQYPDGLLDRLVSGRVVVEFTIDTLGRMTGGSLRVLSATHRAFADLTERFYRSCSFGPGRVAGHVVTTHCWLAMDFSPPLVTLRRSRMKVFYIQDIQMSPAAASLDVARLVALADHDSVALRTLLSIPSRASSGRLDVPSYPSLAAGLVESWGDSGFVAVAQSLAPTVLAEALRAAAPGLPDDSTTFPRLRALIRRYWMGESNPRPLLPDSLVKAGPRLEDGVLDWRGTERRPETIPGSCRSPAYPETLRRAEAQGRVLVEFIIDADGRAEPQSVRVMVSNHPDFSAAAIQAVLSCRYQPGLLNGRPNRVRVQQPITFTINR